MTALAHAPYRPSAQHTGDLTHRGGSCQPASDGLSTEFFGLKINVSGHDLPDLSFQFGPHISGGIGPEPAALHVNLTPLVGRAASAGSFAGGLQAGNSHPSVFHSRSAFKGSSSLGVGLSVQTSTGTDSSEATSADITRELTVARPDGVVVLRRSFRGWSNVPPPIPPFAVMVERFTVTPAVVVAKGDRVLALLGSPGSCKTSIALSLIQHGWRFVSGQLLVTDRKTGRTMPFLVPLELRGSAADQARHHGLVEGSWRVRRSVLEGEILQVRPEALGGVVPVRSQGGPATLIRLCGSEDGELKLRAAEFAPQIWPNQARGTLRHRGTFQLLIPGEQAADEAANRLDAEFAPTSEEDRKVVPIKPFLPAQRG